MPSPKAGWIPLDLGLQGASTAVVAAFPGVAGTVKRVDLYVPVVAGAGSFDVANGTVSLLSGAVNLATEVTGYTGESETLATSTATLKLSATQGVVATWTIDTATSFVGGACTVWVEPEEW